jgi:hypothetical protein
MAARVAALKPILVRAVRKAFWGLAAMFAMKLEQEEQEREAEEKVSKRLSKQT